MTGSRACRAGIGQQIRGLWQVVDFLSAPSWQRLLTVVHQAPGREHLRLRLQLAARPRHSPGTTTVGGRTVRYVDAASLLSSHYDIYVRRTYALPDQARAAVIIDVGANIGLSVLWFLEACPAARIVALEPDPQIYPVLAANIAAVAGVPAGQVELINAAAWHEDGTIGFEADGADGGHVCTTGTRVPTVDIAQILRRFRHIDLLKVDVEGAEGTLLPRIMPYLDRIDRLFIEWHSRTHGEQTLGPIVTTLTEHGFHIQIQSELSSDSPFVRQRLNGDLDNQVNIHAWKRDRDRRNSGHEP